MKKKELDELLGEIEKLQVEFMTVSLGLMKAQQVLATLKKTTNLLKRLGFDDCSSDEVNKLILDIRTFRKRMGFFLKDGVSEHGDVKGSKKI